MIRFKQFIVEIFDNKNTYKFEKDRGGYIFDTGEYKIYVIITRDYDSLRDRYSYDISFKSFGGPGGTSYMPSFTNNLSGSLKVYNTIIEICRNYFKTVLFSRGDQITFSAAHPKTHKIYDRLAKMMAKDINGQLISPDDNSRVKEWVIRRS